MYASVHALFFFRPGAFCRLLCLVLGFLFFKGKPLLFAIGLEFSDARLFGTRCLLFLFATLALSGVFPDALPRSLRPYVFLR